MLKSFRVTGTLNYKNWTAMKHKDRSRYYVRSLSIVRSDNAFMSSASSHASHKSVQTNFRSLNVFHFPFQSPSDSQRGLNAGKCSCGKRKQTHPPAPYSPTCEFLSVQSNIDVYKVKSRRRCPDRCPQTVRVQRADARERKLPSRTNARQNCVFYGIRD